MSAARVQQGAEQAVRRWVNLAGDLRSVSAVDEPFTVRQMPTGLEFMIEVRVLPMGRADE